MTIHTCGLSLTITTAPAPDARAKMDAAWARREHAPAATIKLDPVPVTAAPVTREPNLHYAARRCGLL